MAPIFASADIAAIVAAFPPPVPSKNEPSLVLSSCKRGLFNSRMLLARFEQMIASGTSRLSINDVAVNLGIDSPEWLLQCNKEQLYFDRAGHNIIPDIETTNLRDALKDMGSERFVNLSSFSAEHDISYKSVEAILQHLEGDGYPWQTLGASKGQLNEWFSALSLVTRIESSIVAAVNGARPETCNIGFKFPHVPGVVLSILTKELLEDGQLGDGTLDHEAWNTHEEVVFVPDDFLSVQEEKLQEAREYYLSDMVRRYDRDGFCHVTAQSQEETEEVRLRLVQQLAEEDIDNMASVTVQDHGDHTTLFVNQHVLLGIMTHLKYAVTQEIANYWLPGSSDNIDLALSAVLSSPGQSSSAKSELAVLLMRSKHAEEVKKAANSKINELESADHRHFAELFNQHVLGPVQLYLNGVRSVQEATLKQHLDEFVREYLARDVIPSAKLYLQEIKLLRDKARANEMEKLLRASGESQSASGVQIAVAKAAKKLKIEPPDNDVLANIKQQVLEQKIQIMQKMKRGSDVLQNLIWLLLAHHMDGLFVSSGKDTSRMIKQYQTVGNAEIVHKLEKWRDVLKAGQQSQEDVEDMKGLAIETVRQSLG